MTKSSSPSRLDAFFGNPAAAVGMAVVCNVLWGSAFPFIKMGYRLFAIDATDTASIMCFAGVRFMLSALLVYAGGAALRRGPLPMPKGKNLLSCCGQGFHHGGKVIIAGSKAEIYRRAAGRTLADHIHHNTCLGKHLQMLCQALCAVLGSGEDGKHNILLAADFADTVHKNTPFVLF